MPTKPIRFDTAVSAFKTPDRPGTDPCFLIRWASMWGGTAAEPTSSKSFPDPRDVGKDYAMAGREPETFILRRCLFLGKPFGSAVHSPTGTLNLPRNSWKKVFLAIGVGNTEVQYIRLTRDWKLYNLSKECKATKRWRSSLSFSTFCHMHS